jgi:hypothetical protein
MIVTKHIVEIIAKHNASINSIGDRIIPPKRQQRLDSECLLAQRQV